MAGEKLPVTVMRNDDEYINNAICIFFHFNILKLFYNHHYFFYKYQLSFSFRKNVDFFAYFK